MSIIPFQILPVASLLKILQISRSTLKRYREKGFIKAVQKPTGQFEFDDDSVWLL